MGHPLVEKLDLEVRLRSEQMRAEAELLGKNLQRTFKAEMSKLPRSVRRMTLQEVAEKYGDTSSIEDIINTMSETMQKEFEEWVVSVHKPRRAARTTRKQSLPEPKVERRVTRSMAHRK